MKKILFGLLAVILLVSIAGCGATSVATMPAATTYPAGDQTGFYPPQEAVKHSYGLDKGGLSSLFGGDDGNEAPPPAVIVMPATTTTTTALSSGVEYGALVPAERMVINTASMALVVDDVTASLNDITNLASVNGGYIINSDIREDKNRLYANISFKVEVSKFSDTLGTLRQMAVDVRSETTSGQDVTEEYVDLDAQLRNLEASEAQLLVLMDKAGTVEEILKVQQQLTSTRGQIEQIKGRMQYLEQSSSLSSIYVSLEQSKLTVEFYASSTTVKEGDNIRFIPTIGGGFEPYSYEWDFGDGKTSTEGSPLHDYKSSGAYTVTLTLKDDRGKTAEAIRDDYVNVLSGWDAGNVAGSAWNGLVGFGHFLGALFIWLGILSPIWIGILVILYFTWWRRRKKKA